MLVPRINAGFFRLISSLELYRPRRFTRQIIEHSVNSLNLIDDPAHHLLQNLNGISAASAVIKSIVFTALSATA